MRSREWPRGPRKRRYRSQRSYVAAYHEPLEFKRKNTMNSKEKIQSYINNFRRHISPYLKPNIGLNVVAHPSKNKGAILEIKIGPSIENDDEFFDATSTVNEALEKIPQKAFGGNLKGFNFGGTNVIMEPERIVLIKGGDSEEEWSDSGALEDVKRILPKPKGGGA